MKILIIGLGSIGRRHATLLQKHFAHSLYALRSANSNSENQDGVTSLYSWEDVDRIKPDVALIANPTSLHLATALACAKRSMNLFIEKPIDCSYAKLSDVVALVKQKQVTAYVAYPLRFHPVITEIKALCAAQKILHVRAVCSSYLPDWRQGKDHRATYSAKSNQGGGVVLDLSHEIDYCEYLFGAVTELKGTFGKKSDVTVDSEDYADLLCEFERAHGIIHLDYFSRQQERTLHITTENGFIHGDVVTNTVTHMQSNTATHKNFPLDSNAMYVDQLTYFFENIHNPMLDNNLFSAQNLFKKLIDFKLKGKA